MSIIDLFVPKWKHSSSAVRKEAVSSLDNQNTLMKLVKKDPNTDVCIAAINKLDASVENQLFLSIIVKDTSKSMNIRFAAATRFIEEKWVSFLELEHESEEVQRFIAEIIKDTSKPINIRLTALEMIENETVLEELLDTPEDDIRMSVVKKVTTPRTISKAALTDTNSNIRETAIQQIDYWWDELVFIAENATDKNTQLIALDRLFANVNQLFNVNSNNYGSCEILHSAIKKVIISIGEHIDTMHLKKITELKTSIVEFDEWEEDPNCPVKMRTRYFSKKIDYYDIIQLARQELIRREIK